MTPRSDDPLFGVVVPLAIGQVPDADEPSHRQQVRADLVSRLPVSDEKGGVHYTMPPLKTSADYDVYTCRRTSAWKASRSRRTSAGQSK